MTPNAPKSSCTLIPTTDDGTPANFYPYYSIRNRGENDNQNWGGAQCLWQFGGAIPDSNYFGKNAQYGTLLPQMHLIFGGHGATRVIYPDFQNVIHNPCLSRE